jgi:hypothetical protein
MKIFILSAFRPYIFALLKNNKRGKYKTPYKLNTNTKGMYLVQLWLENHKKS